MSTFRTLEKCAQAAIEEKRSKFIGIAAPVSDESGAQRFLEDCRKAHPEASHHTYAYVLRQGAAARYTDDGEPHGTAGRPMLDVLRHAQLQDCAVCVVRYFGGTLLGKGGLARAYTAAAKQAVAAAGAVEIVPGLAFHVCCAYSQYEPLRALVQKHGGRVAAEAFEAGVALDIELEAAAAPAFEAALREAFAGAVRPESPSARRIEKKLEESVLK